MRHTYSYSKETRKKKNDSNFENSCGYIALRRCQKKTESILCDMSNNFYDASFILHVHLRKRFECRYLLLNVVKRLPEDQLKGPGK